jgi:hypothetical protein
VGENERYEKPEQLQELINAAGFQVLTAVVLKCCISVENQPPFRMGVSLPSSGSYKKPRRKPAASGWQIKLCLFIDPEDGSNTFLQNAG